MNGSTMQDRAEVVSAGPRVRTQAEREDGLSDASMVPGNVVLARQRLNASPGPYLQRSAEAERVRMVRQLQASVGNRQTGLVIARLKAEGDVTAGGAGPAPGPQASSCAGCPPPPVPREPLAPPQDPGFRAVETTIVEVAKGQAEHGPPKAKADEAEGAAEGPADQYDSLAGARQVETITLSMPTPFNRDQFKADVKKAVGAVAPQNRDSAKEAKDLKIEPQMKEVRVQSTQKLDAGNEAAYGPTRNVAGAKPDAGKREPLRPVSAGLQPKTVVPMKAELPGPRPGPVGAEQAAPPPFTPRETSLDFGPCRIDCTMAAANVTDEQLERSNEPSFLRALDGKREHAGYARTAPEAFRQTEQQVLDRFRTSARQRDETGVDAMHAVRNTVSEDVTVEKGSTKSSDEATLAQFSTLIRTTYETTSRTVYAALISLKAKVQSTFTTGEQAARDAFFGYLRQCERERRDDEAQKRQMDSGRARPYRGRDRSGVGPVAPWRQGL